MCLGVPVRISSKYRGQRAISSSPAPLLLELLERLCRPSVLIWTLHLEIRSLGQSSTTDSSQYFTYKSTLDSHFLCPLRLSSSYFREKKKNMGRTSWKNQHHHCVSYSRTCQEEKEETSFFSCPNQIQVKTRKTPHILKRHHLALFTVTPAKTADGANRFSASQSTPALSEWGEQWSSSQGSEPPCCRGQAPVPEAAKTLGCGGKL